MKCLPPVRHQRFCRWCGKRVVMHHIGHQVRIWVHLASGRIWCSRPKSDPLVNTAMPRWGRQRKWNR